MTFAEKIIERRKMLGMSQEELADKLGVSRQSVSKWELGSAVPETDKIIALSDVFGVSCDYLLKDREEEFGEFVPRRELGGTELSEYLDKTKKKLRLIALGVALLILSPITLLMLGAASEDNLVGEAVFLGVGLSALFLIAAVGVSLIIIGCMKLSGEQMSAVRGTPLSKSASDMLKLQLDMGRGAYTAALVAATVLCIVAVIPLIIFAVLELPDIIGALGILIMFALVSVAVYIFITRGSYREECEKLIGAGGENGAESDKLKATVEGVLWPVVVLLYLLVSFTSGRWDITWIIFPISAAISGCIEAFINYKNKK